MYNSSMSRQDFLKSHFLTIKLIDLQKSLLHHNKFVFEIVTDRSTELCRKNYSELKRFTSELASKQGMQEFIIEHHLRSSQQKRQLQTLFKKLNNGYLMVKEGSSENYSEKRQLLRNYLYNLFYNCLENPLSQDEDAPNHPKSEPQLIQLPQKRNLITGSFHQEAKEGREKVEEKKKEQEGKGGRLAKIKSLYRSKAEKEEERKQLLMRGINRVYSRLLMSWLKEGKQWVPKQLSLEQNLLTLSDNTLKTVIVLKKYDMIIAEENYRRILINHTLSKDPLELRLRSPEQAHHDEGDLEDYVKLLTLLKETTMKLNGYNEEVVNFVNIRISNKKNKFSQDNQKRPAKELMLKIIQDSQTFVVGMPIDSVLNILLPITNHYSKLDCEVAQAKQGGIIPTFGGYNIKFTLPVQNIYDQLFNQKPKRKTHEMRYFILGSKLCNYSLKIDYMERGNRWTYCSMHGNDRFEGQKAPTEFSREEFRIQKNRFKRIIYYLESVMHQISSLRNMEYPFQSYFFYFFLALTILLFDPQYILHYSLFLISTLLIYHHPCFPNYTRELKTMLGLESWVTRMDQKLKIRGWGRTRVHFRKQVERRRFLQQFQFTRKKQGSIVQKYQRLHLWLLRGQLVLTELVTFTQKIKNLFLWYHHKKTKELLLLALGTLAVLLFVPVRLILLVGLWKMFRKGLTHKFRVQETNKVILIQIFQNLIEEFGVLEAKGWLLEPTKSFEKKHPDYQTFQKKLKEWLSVQLEVDIDPEVFQESRCMNELIALLSDCRKRFVIPESVCRKYKFNLEWSQEKSGLRKAFQLIYGFIMSTPSDRNILGIAYEQPDKEADFDSDDLEEP